MTSKQSLIIVHGMGEDTAGSFKEEVISSLNYGLKLFADWENKKIEDLVDVVPFTYNDFFNQYREKMANAAEPLASRLATLQLDGIVSQVGDIAAVEANLTKDDFFKTHLLDVILYRLTTLAEPIRIKLAQLICDHIDNKGSQNVHILGYSLGSSVAHDTLASLYASVGQNRVSRNLSPSAEKLSSVHMVANVSRLLQSFVDVGQSVVNPVVGCTSLYYQYRHVVDPFTIALPFEPVDNGIWLTANDLTDFRYKEMRPKLVTKLNTHAISHYLENPVNYVPLLQTLNIGFDPTTGAFESAYNKHKEKSLQGKAGELQSRWEGLHIASNKSITGFVDTAKAMRDMLVEFDSLTGS